jgi:MoaA/NifB/PqqE/SkfB family radical SAM enzyme
MHLNKACEVLTDLKKMGVAAIQLTGGGEPTIHPDFQWITKHIQSLGLPWGLVTNGVNLCAKQAFVASAVWVRVSIDAGMAETYTQMRRVSKDHWYRAWDGVATMADLKGPTVGVSFIVQQENYREMWAATFKALAQGAHYIRFAPLIHPQGSAYFQDWYEKAARDLRVITAACTTPTFQVLDAFTTRLPWMYHVEEPTCHYQHLAPFVGADLNVYRCCNTAFTSHGLLGSLAKQSFSDLWNSPEVCERMTGFDASAHCGYCIFKDKNAAIADLVKTPTSHTCFV